MLDVYKSFYKFDGEPFRLSPDHRFSYVHPSYANARAYLEYAISQGEGFIAITGEPGTGKTTLISGLLAELDQSHVKVATLGNMQLDPDNLIGMVVTEFGLRSENKNRSVLLIELEQFLKKQMQRGQRSVLIVDEAQGLSSGSMEELRLLSNLQHDNRLLLQVFLVGQEELMDMIHLPEMEHLRQRLIAASHLDRLSLAETVAYIEHRLCCVGWESYPSINEAALRLIYKSSSGVPRRINLVCHRLFLYGGLNRKPALVEEDVGHVIAEMSRERILTADLSEDNDDEVAESDNESTLDLNLPRASSCVGNKAQSEVADPQPVATDVPRQSSAISGIDREDNGYYSIREDELNTGGAGETASSPVSADTVSGWRRFGWAVAALVLLLVVLLLSPYSRINSENHLTKRTPAALTKGMAESSRKETGIIENTGSTDRLTSRAGGNVERIITKTEESGAIRRSSAHAAGTVEYANALRAEKEKRPGSGREAPITDGSNGQRLSSVAAGGELEIEAVRSIATVSAKSERRRLRNEARKRFNQNLNKSLLPGERTGD